MAKNKIAMRLTGYFAVCLLVFSMIIGGVFTVLFQRHTVKMRRTELEQRAVVIADTLSGFMGRSGHGAGGGYGAYLRFLDDIAMTDVWIIDSDLQLVTCGQGRRGAELFTYKDLPADANAVVTEVFSGKIAYSESFSEVLNTPTLTVGTPIHSGGTVVGVVLLHSSVDGINAAVGQGFAMLGVSIAVALILAFLLSIWLSKNFTDPIISKEAAEALRLETLRRDFVANISHELKTPVAVLRGSLEALVDEVVTESKQVKGYHREMLTETLYLQRLVGDLLDLSRLQNADFAMEMQEISLDEVVSDAMRSMEHIAADKQITMTLKKNDEPQTICGDYGRLRQLLLVLLDNAVKFSPALGNIEVTLRTGALTIRDHGIGIPTAELPYLFDRFYKSRSEQNKSGTGLGLAIANQIAQRHGFPLTAANAADGGAVFTLQIKQ